MLDALYQAKLLPIPTPTPTVISHIGQWGGKMKLLWESHGKLPEQLSKWWACHLKGSPKWDSLSLWNRHSTYGLQCHRESIVFIGVCAEAVSWSMGEIATSQAPTPSDSSSWPLIRQPRLSWLLPRSAENILRAWCSGTQISRLPGSFLPLRPPLLYPFQDTSVRRESAVIFRCTIWVLSHFQSLFLGLSFQSSLCSRQRQKASLPLMLARDKMTAFPASPLPCWTAGQLDSNGASRHPIFIFGAVTWCLSRNSPEARAFSSAGGTVCDCQVPKSQGTGLRCTTGLLLGQLQSVSSGRPEGRLGKDGWDCIWAQQWMWKERAKCLSALAWGRDTERTSWD